MLGYFFGSLAEVVPLTYSQDAAGGRYPDQLPGPGTAAPPSAVACAVLDSGFVRTEGEGKQARVGATANVRVFFRSDPVVKASDRIRIYRASDGAYVRTVTCDGPAFDMSGLAAIFEVKGVDKR